MDPEIFILINDMTFGIIKPGPYDLIALFFKKVIISFLLCPKDQPV